MEVFAVDKTTAYQALKDAADKLFNREFEYEVFFIQGKEGIPSTITNIPPKVMGREDWSQKLKTRWVSKSLYEPNRGLVFITFTPEVLQYLTDLRAYFTQYYLSQTVELSSGYAFRLFEIVMQWKSVGKTPIISIDELRGRLGVEVGQYSEMHNFKKRVLDVAVEQVSKGEYTVTYKQHKAGRTITGFEFFFTINKKKEKIKSLGQQLNTIELFTGKTDKEREIIAQKNAYAEQIGATAEHRENLIRQGLTTHRQAEQTAQEQKQREKAERQAQEQQTKEQLALAQRQFEQILASDELIDAYIANNRITAQILGSGLQRLRFEQGDFREVFKMEKYKIEQLDYLKHLNLRFLD